MKAIYKIECKPTGKIYVGMSVDVDARWSTHRCELRQGKHGNTHLQRAWSKYGESAFVFEVLEQLEGDLVEAEVRWVSKLSPAFNQMIAGFGGSGGALGCSEAKAKKAASIAAYWARPESVELAREAGRKRMEKKPHTEEVKARLRAAALAQHSTPEGIANRKKISERMLVDAKRKRTPRSEESKERTRAALLAYHYSRP